MCGRYTHLFTWKQLHRLMRLTTAEVQIPLRYNVSPSQEAPIVRAIDGDRGVEFYRWGLVPSWAKDPGGATGFRTVNARMESVATTPAYREAFRKRRCLVPASGFYEWQQLPSEGGKGGKGRGKAKQPWYFTPADGGVFVFAGLWERWTGQGEAEPLHTFTVVTTNANGVVGTVHPRMPLILSPDSFDLWLDPTVTDPARLQPLLAPCPDALVAARPVGTWVNTPKHDDARCIEDAAAAADEPDEGGLWGAAEDG